VGERYPEFHKNDARSVGKQSDFLVIHFKSTTHTNDLSLYT